VLQNFTQLLEGADVTMSYYSTNPQAIHETIEGETIIIDLATGTYYSLRGAAPPIWNALSEGESVSAVVSRLSSVYDADEGVIAPAVDSFLAQLKAVCLIAPTADAPATTDRIAAPAPSERRPFELPMLETYEDMQDIILLDPVHKVDSQGWPHASPVEIL